MYFFAKKYVSPIFPIRRTALRRKLIDFALGFAALGATALALLVYSVPMTLGIAAIVTVPAWAVWTRHRIAAAARTLAVDEPRTFFAAAIENARAERRFLTVASWLALPYLFLAIAIIYAARGLTSLDLMLEESIAAPPAKTLALAAAILFILAWIVRANRAARAHLRRLERMRSDWGEQEASDGEEGA